MPKTRAAPSFNVNAKAVMTRLWQQVFVFVCLFHCLTFISHMVRYYCSSKGCIVFISSYSWLVHFNGNMFTFATRLFSLGHLKNQKHSFFRKCELCSTIKPVDCGWKDLQGDGINVLQLLSYKTILLCQKCRQWLNDMIWRGSRLCWSALVRGTLWPSHLFTQLQPVY